MIEELIVKSKKNKSEKNSGITLISLVITIIILIILAGVSISLVLGKNGIITKAQIAKIETRGASVEEARDIWRLNKEVDKTSVDTTAQTLEELIDSLVKQNQLTEDEKDIILGNKEKGIEAQWHVEIGSRDIYFRDTSLSKVASIGDYVSYTPDKAESYNVEAVNSGLSEDYYLDQEKFNWRVFDIKDDGRVELISDKSSDSSFDVGHRITTLEIEEKDTRGYNNVVFLLNDMCKKLYSKNGVGSARSIKLEDLYNKVTEPIRATSEEGSFWMSANYPNIILNAKNIKLNGIEGEWDMSEQPHLVTGCTSSNNVVFVNVFSQYPVIDKKMNPKAYEVLLNENSGEFWLATRVHQASRKDYKLGVYSMSETVGFSRVTILELLANSGGTGKYESGHYRVVVELNKDVAIKEGINSDGKTPETAWCLR